MIPMIARLAVRRPDGSGFRLWLPLFLLWLIALPFLVVSLPVVALVLWMLGRRPFAIFAAYWGVLRAMPGASVEVNGRRNSVVMQVM